MEESLVLAVCVGSVTSLGDADAFDPLDKAWTSGIFKSAVQGPVRVTSSGLAGDAQADLADHGGPDKALCAYAAAHYPNWRLELEERSLAYGAFGENLTLAHVDEARVCIGDRWRHGDLVLEVSQPRQPCWKLGRKWRRPSLPEQVLRSGRTGWYFRVRSGGELTVGDTLVLEERPNPEWTVSAANRVMHERAGDVRVLAGLEALSVSWRNTLLRRVGVNP